jgi:tetratricopeptide (TPR) repeat protein
MPPTWRRPDTEGRAYFASSSQAGAKTIRLVRTIDRREYLAQGGLIDFMGNKSRHLCACGSGKRAKLCCGKLGRTMKLTLTPRVKLEMRWQVEKLDLAGRHPEACEILNQLLAASPRNPLIWNDLGVQYEACGQIDRALEALRRGHLCDSTYPPILYNLGTFTLNKFVDLQNSGKLTGSEGPELLREAAEFLNANLDRDPDNADAHYNLALVYALSGEASRAQIEMKLALRMKRGLQLPSGWLLG